MKIALSKKPFKLTFGERGEMIAAGHLVRQGYKILEKNYRCKLGEIDVVAEKNGRIYFIEIKTRTSSHFGRPEEAVGYMKQRKILMLAQWYLKEKKWENKPVSFEVIAIIWNVSGDPDIRLIPNAFGAADARN